ncbi:MAG: hypothetical protein GF313_04660 [Caldithrix sp.]|nr:hypothetical protein [Caldithrix sp.]
MHRTLYLTILSLTAALLISSCGDSSTGSDDNNNNNQAPELQVQQVEVPQAMQTSSDPKAQQTVSYVGIANSFSQYSAAWTPPQGASNLAKASGVNDWSYEWTTGQLTIKMTVTETDDTFQWRIVYDGTLGGQTFDNWTYMEATRSKDGSDGQMYIYAYNTEKVELEWHWMVDDNDVYNFEMISESLRILVNANPNKSGQVEVFNMNNGAYLITFKSVWDQNGAGQWWEYDGEGDVSDNGDWDV